jgi:hypothetical protein
VHDIYRTQEQINIGDKEKVKKKGEIRRNIAVQLRYGVLPNRESPCLLATTLMQ